MCKVDWIKPGVPVEVFLLDGYRIGVVRFVDGRDICIDIPCQGGAFQAWVDVSQCSRYVPKDNTAAT